MREITPEDLVKLLQFSHLLSKLKTILRFKGMPYWQESSIDRWDSDAEHMYRMAMLAILLSRYNDKPLNIEKLLKIILFHDCIEIITGDEFPFTKQGEQYVTKETVSPERQQKDLEACDNLTSQLPREEAEEFRQLVQDFIAAQTDRASASNEAYFAVALDRIEATLTVIEYRKQEGTWNAEHKKLQLAYMQQKIPMNTALLQAVAKLIEEEAKQLKD